MSVALFGFDVVHLWPYSASVFLFVVVTDSCDVPSICVPTQPRSVYPSTLVSPKHCVSAIYTTLFPSIDLSLCQHFMVTGLV